MSQVSNPEWPPKSPHEALLSTPGGRRRLQRLQKRASPSPSPIKSTSMRSRTKNTMDPSMGADDSEDDEETLELQLQEIQARLKLKKLQKKSKQGSDTENENRTGPAPLPRANSVAAGRAQSRIGGVREEQIARSKSQASIHVPVSPIRRAARPPEAQSPQRVLLGIDKGLTGRDISLKRAPSVRKKEGDIHDKRTGPFLQRPTSQAAGRASSAASSTQDGERPKSFSERMASIRAQDTDWQERQARIKKSRSMAFDIGHEEMESFKATAVELPDAPQAAHKFSRDEVLNSYHKPRDNLPRSKTTPNLRSAMRTTSSIMEDTTLSSSMSDSRGSLNIPPRKPTPTNAKTLPSDSGDPEISQFEPFSSMHLSKRIIPHQVLTRTLSGKKSFLLPDILRTVKAPDFSGPDIEEDVVIIAVISKKTSPRAHQENSKNSNRGKYMIMGLTDLKWELDLFLFDSGFDKFWKLPVGTVIAILNPGFMPPPRGKADTGKFSLTLNSDADTILEIGSARDLGFCKSIKKDGATCDSWVDKRHTEFCEFHVNLTLQKSNTRHTMSFPKGDYGGRKFNSRNMTGHLERIQQEKMDQKTRYDKDTHSQIFIGKKSTANLLDDTDFAPDAFHRGSTKEERMRRQILALEKEHELEKKLGKLGSGIGADYMRAKHTARTESSASHSKEVKSPPPDAVSLGLLKVKAKDITLSPVKRKRTDTASSSTSSAARGWGSDLSKELGRMKNGESLQPVKKKTRFVTEKGIREAGRESIGGDAAKAILNDFNDDDSDDLDIVRE
ncbi:Primase zinc finger [Venustampulla echinocandica]|uniref:Primase zinc finger n=1 Tax=Venustampulla echinocandica TaxID=2656787 RepID=A0A370U240_9HELO|nr:Primase zinc finger [Venustampulla echinocandica]RDL41831.1 Primase zinc finger [Venustampulla echinocandica]